MESRDPNTSLSEVGATLRRLGVTLKISYGSGGYCVLLTNREGGNFGGYSWDIETAFSLAKAKYESEHEDNWDEDTQVDYRSPNGTR